MCLPALCSAFCHVCVAIRLIGPYGVTQSMQIEALTIPGVHIFSNSWGARDNTFDGPSPRVNSALARGVSQVKMFVFGRHRSKQPTIILCFKSCCMCEFLLLNTSCVFSLVNEMLNFDPKHCKCCLILNKLSITFA